MSSQLTNAPTTTTTTQRGRRAASSRRSGTMDLETQSGYKFGLAVVLGVAAAWATMPVAGSAALLIIAVVLAGRALTVLAADPQAARRLRPREFATWDGALAATLALVAIVLMFDGAVAGAFVGGAAAIALAVLRLRTRYVAG